MKEKKEKENHVAKRKNRAREKGKGKLRQTQKGGVKKGGKKELRNYRVFCPS